jgi:pimeloyl-ACP methyl ester carboxylesterase
LTAVDGPVERTVGVNGIELAVREQGHGRPVILCHGFPELGYSWRHQLPVLAGAGWRAVAPDLRGYGASSTPRAVEDYGIAQLTGDLLGLLDDLGEERAVFVGHDWGALIVWDLALMHPERVAAVVGVSVPFVRYPMPPVQLFRSLVGDRFFYIVYFQDVGPPEAELDGNPRRALEAILWRASGEGMSGRDGQSMVGALPAEGTGFVDSMGERPADRWPQWLTPEDVDVYVDAFTRSGFFGPLSLYRNMDANYELTKDLGNERVAMPSFFIGGELDPVVSANRAMVDAMGDLLPGFLGSVLIPGVGHWTQQESPEAFNQALLGFLGRL